MRLAGAGSESEPLPEEETEEPPPLEEAEPSLEQQKVWRALLDRLIQKIQLNEQAVEEPYIRLVKQLAVDDKLDLETARLLIQEYRKAQKEES